MKKVRHCRTFFIMYVFSFLIDYFGEDTVYSMRKSYESCFENEVDSKKKLALKWQYADKEAMGQFLESNFLLDTILEEDYIVYTFASGNKKEAYLMFMVTEDEPLFQIDTQYASEIISRWNSKGYETRILRECIDINFSEVDEKKYLKVGVHSEIGKGAGIYEIQSINGKNILVYSLKPCWMYYYKKVIALSDIAISSEYDCLFAKDVLLTNGNENKKNIIGSGIAEIKKFLSDNNPRRIVYREFENTKTYLCELVAREKVLSLYINRQNLIAEININKLDLNEHVIIDLSDNSYGSLIEKAPFAKEVRALNPIQIHGYAIQIMYNDNSIRNYYLKSFDTLEIPNNCDIEGYIFDINILNSVKLNDNGSVSFGNGYYIPRHILYYHSYRQVNVEYTDKNICTTDNIKIKSLYRLPLMEFINHDSIKQYYGNLDECFGPKKPWLDSKGNRISDIALYSIFKGNFAIGATKVRVEPSGKWGYIKDDGTWLIPPIYEYIEDKDLYGDCVKATRNKNGEEVHLFLTPDGNEHYFDCNVENFENGRGAFSIEKWQGDNPIKGYYDDILCDIKPGKWGFMDLKGNIIVEPKYVFVIGFGYEGEYSVVARFVDDNLCWGVIDLDGNEVIPCRYTDMYCICDEAVAFQLEENGPYGIMGFDGKIIIEPMFSYIKEYDSKRGLITVGEDEDTIGVYSVDLKCMLIEPEYDYIDYYNHMICCEVTGSDSERYFDYDGKELYFHEYDTVYEVDGLLNVWKNGKQGIIDWNGNVIVPPVLNSISELSLEKYKRGFIVTEAGGKQGLSKVNGEEIIPTKYSEIKICGDFVIASQTTETHWCICDSLFTINGTLLLEGTYRHISINEKYDKIRFETPMGVEHCEIIYKEANKN